MRVATGDTQAGSRVADLYPSLAGGYPDLAFEKYDPDACDGLDLVFLGLPHGASQDVVPELAGRVGHVVDLAADFRLRDPGLYPRWYGDEHAHPELLDDFVYGLPELFRDRIAGATHVAAPGCYVTTAVLALAPLLRAGLVAPTGIVVDAASGVSGAGRPPKPTTTFCTVDENFTAYGLLDHRHTPEIEQGLADVAGADVQVLFTPHLAPMNRGILATCYARPADPLAGPSTADLLALLRAAWADEPFVVVTEASPSTKATAGSNSVHVTAMADERTGLGRGPRRPRQPGQGGVGSGHPVRQPDARPARGRGPPCRGHVAVSVVAPAGFVAGGVACGIKASGDADLALVATADGAPVAAAGVFTQNLVVAAPVTVSRRHLAATGGRAAAVVVSSGNANAATGAKGEADAEQMCALAADGIGAAADEVLVCSTGLIGYELPMDALSAGIPAVAAGRGGDPAHGGAAAEAIMTTDTRRKETVIRGDGFVVGGMAKGAAMLAPNMATMLAVLTTDAAVEPEALRTALQAGVADSFNATTIDGCTSTNDTVLILASGRAGAPDPDAFAAAVAEACLDLARRWWATPRVTRRWSRCRSPGPRPTTRPAPPPARWPRASSSSARGSARTPTGAGWRATWAPPAWPSTPRRFRSPTGRRWSAGGAWASTTTPPRSPPTWRGSTSS